VIIKRLNLQTAGEGLTSTIWIYSTLVSSHTHITEHLTLLGIMLLERLSTGFGERVSNHCYSTARVCLFLFCCLCESYFFWQKMFYSDNLLLSVLARSCKESAVAVADAYNISVFDLLHLDSSCFKNVFWDYFTSIAHLYYK